MELCKLTWNDVLRAPDAFAAKISYKQGWSFELRLSSPGEWLLTVRARVTDADGGSNPVVLTHGRTISSREARETYSSPADAVRELIREVELHEVDEWLRIADVRVTDPHPELAPLRAQVELLVAGRRTSRS